MTLVEVMMAVAVFGIILAFTSQMTTTSNRISGDNFNRVMMMELAQAEMERVKAGGVYGTHGEIEYPPGGSEQKFYITYNRDDTEPLYVIMQIVVGPVPAAPGPLSADNPDNYVLVSYIPPVL
ncbi:MAG: hypothetical protein VR68_15620 [Peptococcaceae bacterium BRH_c4a]|nr:MAG: hypothetical protein VR68_15620 [Peptococcaceae bacterium BRH_c4a]